MNDRAALWHRSELESVHHCLHQKDPSASLGFEAETVGAENRVIETQTGIDNPDLTTAGFNLHGHFVRVTDAGNMLEDIRASLRHRYLDFGDAVPPHAEKIQCIATKPPHHGNGRGISRKQKRECDLHLKKISHPRDHENVEQGLGGRVEHRPELFKRRLDIRA
jgi:hypothetical protein